MALPPATGPSPARRHVVGLYEYGDPDRAGPCSPSTACPSCGAGFDWADEPATARGLRVAGPRPPAASAGPRDRRWPTVGDYPARVAALADAFGIERFAVLGLLGRRRRTPWPAPCRARRPGRRPPPSPPAWAEVGVWAEADDFSKTDRQMLDLCVKHPRDRRACPRALHRRPRPTPAPGSAPEVASPKELRRRATAGPGAPRTTPRRRRPCACSPGAVPARRPAAWSTTTGPIAEALGRRASATPAR